MDRRTFLIALVSIFGFMLGSLVFTIIYRQHYKHVKPKPKVKIKVITKTIVKIKKVPVKNINVEALADWIYKHSYRCSKRQAEEYARIISKQEHPLLIASIIANESSFNPTAVSKAGAIGMMQILPTKSHVEQLKKAGIINETRDLFEANTNIKAGAYLFADMLKLNNNDIAKTLKMYVGGSSIYVNKVLETLGQLTIQVRGD